MSGEVNPLGNSDLYQYDSGSIGNLGKDEFLKMLVTQLRYQDPLSPLDNTEFTAQLAQFTTLETMQDIRDNFASSLMMNQSLNNMMAASIIGKRIVVSGNDIDFNGDNVTFGAYFTSPADKVVIKIKDDEGNVVRTMELNDAYEDYVEFEWDGKDNNGSTVADGHYTFSIEGYDSDGNGVSVGTYSIYLVDSIRYEDGVPYLMSGDKEWYLSDIYKIMGDYNG